MRWLSLLALFAAASPASAEGAPPERPIGLRDAIELAVRQNPTLAAAVADVAFAGASVEAARGLDDWILEGKATWVRNRNQIVGGSPVQQPSFDDVSSGVSLTKPLPTGGRMALRLSTEYSRTEFATQRSDHPGLFDRQSSEVYAPSLQLTVQHPLLRGFGVDVARADRRRAAVRRDFAALSREATVAALLRDVVVAYGDLAYAEAELDIRKASVGAAREQLRRVAADIEVGKQPPSGSAEVEVAIARRDEAVLFAEQAIVERSIELERLIGQPIDRSSTTLVAADELPSPPDAPSAGDARDTPSLGDALVAAMDRNPQLRAAEMQWRAASIEVEVTENGRLPLLDFSLGGGPMGNAGDPRTAYSALAGLHGYTVGAGLIFQEPMGRHAARGANDAARATLHKAALGETDIRQQVATAVVRGVVALETARRRAGVLGRSVDAAALDLAAERARFESGRSTNFDVLRRQDELAQVKLSALRARADYMKALAGVESLTGAILNRYGVQAR